MELIGIVARLDVKDALECVHILVEKLLENGFKVGLEYGVSKLIQLQKKRDYDYKIFTLGSTLPDLLVVVGGDGTILRVLHAYRGSISIIGVKFGRRGFLAGFECSEVESLVKALVNKNITWCKAERLRSVKLPLNQELPLALNEVAVVGSRGKTIELEIRVGSRSHQVYHLKGDGVLIATAVGSYAYTAAAQGPLLKSEKCVVITPLNPLAGLSHPLVIDSSVHIEVQVGNGYRAAWVLIDGQFSTPIVPGEVLSVKSSESPVYIGYSARCPWE
ncbi:ATP-NAD/AcoX kinase [Pyrolobus fumarii 1A]|uniref:ATP-NAD/AcoX kinase n=1 Tax=Pyrolobus fumarii (strain DSM 11204 / 1A) TaxID=694429 RepID=G0EED6_PYRF1|nr:NAD(+)/NADH kinase [Pyrolobus fumarii]AEM37977.1 ATP-NAD/AcoX kinase [Pyrolobus fumarii 1A]